MWFDSTKATKGHKAANLDRLINRTRKPKRDARGHNEHRQTDERTRAETLSPVFFVSVLKYEPARESMCVRLHYVTQHAKMPQKQRETACPTCWGELGNMIKRRYVWDGDGMNGQLFCCLLRTQVLRTDKRNGTRRERGTGCGDMKILSTGGKKKKP